MGKQRKGYVIAAFDFTDSATLYMCQRIAEATGVYLYDFFKDMTF